MRLYVTALALLLASVVAAPRVHAENEVNHLTISQWVSLASSDSLTGRVVVPSVNGEAKAIADAKVTLLSSDGKVWRATSDQSGQFTVANMKPGIYSVTAKAKDIFACCAMHVLDSQTASGANFPSEVEIAAAEIDYTLVKTAVIRYLPARTSKAAVVLPTEKLSEVAKRVCGDQYLRVMQSEGGMKGILRLAGGGLEAADLTNVFVVKGGETVARAVTDREGNFQIDELPAGEYSLLAVGSAGVGLAGFELVGEEPQKEAAGDDKEKLIKIFGHHHQHCCSSFEMQVAPMPEIIHCCDETIVDGGPIVDGCGCGVPGEIIGDGGIVVDGFGTPLDGGYVPGGGYGGYGGYGGGYGGYGGGGGGGGFGGGGIGGIAALAGLGGLIAVAVDDDDNPVITPPEPVSPIQ
ncbi:SD repeat-containing protein [Rhodopirellula maiorica SM1]|uniref:SD repeat-containing protein n=1 Tax=Rhodopirellula maiorica SM1 TaxID=1265738 RepID=M5RX44_9BACT|nr:carboxypeptidase-like regulatory domain-containing protein [Rhodopirellula maiorica]EMI18519.1 SD repeat-containing protein [Rhodopirellula maiorica SM1]